VIKIHLATIVPKDVKKEIYLLWTAIKKNLLRAVIVSTFPHQRFEGEVNFASYRKQTRIRQKYCPICSMIF